MDKTSQNKIIEAIQLICSSNLQLNRFRRATIAPHLKPELRKQVLSLPVTHNSFFGEDFNKATDNLIKEQSALDKIIIKKPITKRLSYNKTNNANAQGYQNNKQFFRSNRGHKYQRGHGSNRTPYYNNNKMAGPFKICPKLG